MRRAGSLLASLALLLPVASHAQEYRVGVAESYEGHATSGAGVEDSRGQTRHGRLVELLQSWELAGADYGVLNGDNIANTLASWPLLEATLLSSTVPVYLVAGNHDWVNQTQPDGTPHPDSCVNLAVDEQTLDCPNFIYLSDYLQSRFGIATPWYSVPLGDKQLVFLADDRWDPRSAGDSDISSTQFYWFRDFVAANSSSQIIVFAHHPVFRTVAGTWSTTSTRNRLGWRPKMGEYAEDGTANLTQGSPVVDLVGAAVDAKRVAAGMEFQRDLDSRWYTIASVSGSQITLTEPYEGPTELAVSYLAGGHWNELNEIFRDPANSIRLVLTGHTGGDFRDVDLAGAGQLEVIGNKTFAYSGGIAPTYGFGASLTIFDDQTLADLDVSHPDAHAYGEHTRISYGGSWNGVESIELPPVFGETATLELENPVTVNGSPQWTFSPVSRGVDERTESRMLELGPGYAWVHAWNFENARFMGLLRAEPLGTTPIWLAWPVTGGSWSPSVTNPDRLAPDPGATALAVYGEPSWSRYELSVEMDHPTSGRGGLIFRSTDSGEHYAFEVDGAASVFRLSMHDGTTTEVLDEVALPATPPAVWQLEVNARGSRLRAIANGVLVSDLDEGRLLTGRVGLTATGEEPEGIRFRDFVAYGDHAPIGVPEPSLQAGPVGAALLVLVLFWSLRASRVSPARVSSSRARREASAGTRSAADRPRAPGTRRPCPR